MDDIDVIKHDLMEDQRLDKIEARLESLETDIRDLVDAWKAASWLVGFIKWVGGLAVAITAITLLIKGKV